MRFAEYEIALRYKKLSPAEIRYHLKKVQTSILKDNPTGKLYALPSKITEHAYKILKLYDIKFKVIWHQARKHSLRNYLKGSA